MSFELLTRPGRTPDIILYLLEKGESCQSELSNDLEMSPNTIRSAAKSLATLGFLYERREVGWPTRKYYALTYKGEEMARSLLPVEAILKGTPEGFRKDLSELLKRRKTRRNLEKTLELSLRLQEITKGSGEWEESLEHSKRVLELSEKLESKKNKAEGYRNIGFINQKREGYEESARNFEESLEIALELEDFDGASRDEYALGVTFEKLGDYDKSTDHYESSMELARKVENPIIEARAHLGVGRNLVKRGEPRKSVDEMKAAVTKLEELGEFEELPRAYANLGSSTFSVDEEESLRWHEKCVEASRKSGDLRMLGYGYSNAAACLINERKWKKSEEYLGKAMDIFQKLDEKEMISSVYIHVGNLHRLRREWTKAKENFLRSYNISRESNLPHHLGDTLFHRGLMFKEKGELDEAKSDLERAFEIFDKLGDEDRMQRIRMELENLTR